jgi:hypothetical protein
LRSPIFIFTIPSNIGNEKLNRAFTFLEVYQFHIFP